MHSPMVLVESATKLFCTHVRLTLTGVGTKVGFGRVSAARATTATISLTRAGMTLRASWIDERGSVLGASGTGALALRRGATTAFIEAKQTSELAEGWALKGSGLLGFTRLLIDPTSVITGWDAAHRVALQHAGDRVRLRRIAELRLRAAAHNLERFGIPKAGVGLRLRSTVAAVRDVVHQCGLSHPSHRCDDGLHPFVRRRFAAARRRAWSDVR